MLVMMSGIVSEKNQSWVQGSSRGILYSFLSAVFKDEISTGQVDEFLGKNLTHLQEAFALLPEQKAAPLLDSLNKLAATWEKRCEENGQEGENLELRKEFAFLFLTPHGVNPFESIYRGKRKHLMDTPWEKVRDFYRQVGLEKDKQEKHPEDHVAVELGFMAGLAFLSGRALPELGPDEVSAEEINGAINVQCDFLKQHLLQWVPRLGEDIAGKSRHPFYRSIGELVGHFLHADREMLEALCMELEKNI